ncbi:GerAB/ArcD/ProY family transporter [Cohnella panacarvi]|uniref:GerAB/ArcD/ProY family transporter n=1 Tax=Cohnella panacarvi TaxID=400776 RepID=UPI00047A431D|nr:GerAB/ArcD/ProY family transporter [Cohnella panacarvi]
MERISQPQLAALVVMFQIGSSPLFLLGASAGADAWIAVLVAMLAGLLLLVLLTLQIRRLEPDKDLVEMFRTYFGRVIGYAFAIAYFVYFSYKSVRNIREFGDLMILYLLPSTPLFIVIGCVLIVAGFAVWQGIEAFTRMTQIIMPVVLIIYAAFFFMIYASGLFDIHRIQPIADKGLGKVAEAALPEIVSFPFGEMVLFLMLWKYVASKKKTFRTTIRCYVYTGLFLTATNIVIIASLGPISQISVVPFIQIMSQVEIASVIERLDPLAASLIFAGVFIKMTAYFFGAFLVGGHLVKTKKRYLVVGVGAVLFIGALTFRSYMQHIWFGFEQNLKYHFPMFQIYIPALLLLVMLFRSRLRADGNRQS